MPRNHYILRGGVEGRERLRTLARVMRPSAVSLLERVGVKPGMRCLDVGCGGGDLTLDLARMVGPTGRVVGTEIDATKVSIARAEAQHRQVENVAFELADIESTSPGESFDLVHARFVLTHLPNPRGAIARMASALNPGGVLVLQDIDFLGHFCYPSNDAFDQYVRLYSAAARHRGVDPNIGQRLPRLLREAGMADVQVNVVQPAGMCGDVKQIAALTMENIADSVIGAGLASKAEIDQIVHALYALAEDETYFLSVARIVQSWGFR